MACNTGGKCWPYNEHDFRRLRVIRKRIKLLEEIERLKAGESHWCIMTSSGEDTCRFNGFLSEKYLWFRCSAGLLIFPSFSERRPLESERWFIYFGLSIVSSCLLSSQTVWSCTNYMALIYSCCNEKSFSIPLILHSCCYSKTTKKKHD